jgi:hypothetical protein
MRRAVDVVRACLRDDATCSGFGRNRAQGERRKGRGKGADGQAGVPAAVIQHDESRAATAGGVGDGERGGQARMGQPGRSKERLEGAINGSGTIVRRIRHKPICDLLTADDNAEHNQ